MSSCPPSTARLESAKERGAESEASCASSPREAAAVAVEGVDVAYGDLLALQSVSVDVTKGERLAVVGESGAGKSTLLHVIGGLIRPTAGSVSMGGRDVARVGPAQRSVGLLFQSEALFPHMSVFDNVAFPLYANRWSRHDTRKRVLGLLHQVGLDRRTDALPRELSGGQRQRVALARALALRPSVLLFDEPLANLDSALRRRLRELLLQLHAQDGFTLIMVTHDPDEAAQVGQRIAVLRSGRLVALGTGHALYWSPPSKYVATLLGPCNEFPASVEYKEGALSMVVGGKRVPLPPGVRLPSEDSSRVVLMVRPEAVLLFDVTGTSRPESAWTGRVVAARDLSRIWSVQIECEGFAAPVEAHLPAGPGARTPVVGEALSWTLDWARAHPVIEDAE